jgi:hypothetical protein
LTAHPALLGSLPIQLGKVEHVEHASLHIRTCMLKYGLQYVVDLGCDATFDTDTRRAAMIIICVAAAIRIICKSLGRRSPSSSVHDIDL